MTLNTAQSSDDALLETHSDELLTVYIQDQPFGIPILQVQDVLGHQVVTPVPLSAPEIEGALNLRGRIVTAINVRKRLGLEPLENSDPMSVVVEYEGELFSLLIDRVGDVLRLGHDSFEKTPATLDPLWKEAAMGIHQLDNTLLIVLDISKLLDFGNK